MLAHSDYIKRRTLYFEVFPFNFNHPPNFFLPHQVLDGDEWRVVEDEPVLVPVHVVRRARTLPDVAGEEELTPALHVQVRAVVDVCTRIWKIMFIHIVYKVFHRFEHVLL